MAHRLLRLTQRLCNKPQLISPSSIGAVMAYLDGRNSGVNMHLDVPSVHEQHPAPIQMNGKVGMLSIDGALTNIKYEGECGETGCSYEGLVEQTKELISEGVSTIILDIDSGGGEAYGCFEAANEVRQLCTANNIRVLAYVDGMACSAAYAWASIADELIVNPMADVGSIGVVVQLMNTMRYEKAVGLDRTFVYAGDSKIPFDAEGNFTESFITDIQTSVDFFYDSFVNHVAKYRNLSPQQVKDTQAKVFLPKEALSLGLVDNVMTKQEFINYAFS
jgi:signal peptide peptidase SppA